MINKEDFIKWTEDHFENVSIHGDQIKVNSIFTDDYKGKLYISTEKNAYHCWKTDKSGNLFDLVMKRTGCTYSEAIELISDNNAIRKLENRVHQLFEEKPKKEPKILLPNHVYNIFDLDPSDNYRIIAEKYLTSRKLPVEKFLVCKAGEYKMRIFIPYYDKSGSLIYWNSRTLKDDPLRYRGPENEGIGKSDVLYMTNWNAKKIYLTEGEFDALSLFCCGFSGTACGGKSVDDKQIEILKNYQVCICFDTDKSGGDALNKIGKKIAGQVKDLSYVRPPEKFKDWNKMLVECNENIVRKYIEINEKIVSQSTFDRLKI